MFYQCFKSFRLSKCVLLGRLPRTTTTKTVDCLKKRLCLSYTIYMQLIEHVKVFLIIFEYFWKSGILSSRFLTNGISCTVMFQRNKKIVLETCFKITSDGETFKAIFCFSFSIVCFPRGAMGSSPRGVYLHKISTEKKQNRRIPQIHIQEWCCIRLNST